KPLTTGRFPDVITCRSWKQTLRSSRRLSRGPGNACAVCPTRRRAHADVASGTTRTLAASEPSCRLPNDAVGRNGRPNAAKVATVGETRTRRAARDRLAESPPIGVDAPSVVSLGGMRAATVPLLVLGLVCVAGCSSKSGSGATSTTIDPASYADKTAQRTVTIDARDDL